MSASPNWVFSMFAFLGFVAVSIPLPWHLESWNTGTCLYMIWTGLSCLNQFINSVVWNQSAINYAPAWCDISTKFMIGSSVAIPAASLCINRRLYHIATITSVTKTEAQKRRNVMVDLSIGLGLPLLEMILQYIVQGHRFEIFEDIGCFPYTYNTPPAYALVFCWPIAIGLVSACYCMMTIRALAARRSQFKELLSMNKNLNSSRYFRLMALAGVEVLCTTPLAAYSIYLNASAQQIQPWISWDNVHYNFSRVGQVPAVVWQSNYLGMISLELSRWAVVLCAFIFFAFFGFAEEARRHYKAGYLWVANRVGLPTGFLPPSSPTAGWSPTDSKDTMSYGGGTGAMPVFVTQRMEQKRDSLTSFSTNLSISEFGGAFDDIKEPYSPTMSSSSSSAGSLRKVRSLSELPVRPEPTLDLSSPPRHSCDAPLSPVDMV